MQFRLYKAGWKLIDVLFPPRCAGCGSWGDRYCPTCFENTALIAKPICQICGDRLVQVDGVICDRCKNQPVSYAAVRSWAAFQDPLQSAIHQLKYRRDRGLGEVLSEPLYGLYMRYRWPIDLVVPVPLDEERQKERGYNQAALLARPLAWKAGVPYMPGALKRVRRTRQQVGLSRGERLTNMAGAFKGDPDQVSGKFILVIDDVITTGSTINSCSQALLKAGAEQVYGLTLARSSRI